MTQITLDAALRSKLHDLSQPLELCDEQGHILARVIPVLDPSQYEAYEEPITPEELERRRHEPEISTAELLAYLRSL